MEDARFDPAWHQATPSFLRRLLRAALRDALLALVLVLVVEGGLRAFAPGTRRYIHTPEITGGHPIRRNSLGLREREFAREPPPGQVRVLCLGNSTTWGSSVAVEDAYPRQLERLLASHGDYFVINAGGEGSSVARALRFLVRDGLSYRPSIVILGFSPSMVSADATRTTADVERGPSSRTPMSTSKRILHFAKGELKASYAYVFWDANVRKPLYALGVLKDSVTAQATATYAYAFDAPGFDLAAVEATYERVGDRIGEMRDVLAARKIDFLVVGIPSQFEISEEPVDNERRFELDRIRIQPLSRLGRELEQRGIPFVNLLPRLRAERSAMLRGAAPWDDLYVFDYAHLSPRGYRIASEELLARMKKEGFLNRTISQAAGWQVGRR